MRLHSVKEKLPACSVHTPPSLKFFRSSSAGHGYTEAPMGDDRVSEGLVLRGSS